MIYTDRLRHAIRFSIKTHEVYQKQKRKGKDIPYIVHPLAVGLMLSRAGAREDVVIAGILHDTIEDSIEAKKVTRAMLVERFGEDVAGLVESVTEPDKSLSWDDRKKEALEHISHFSDDSVLLKSADVIANNAELLEDYAKEGEAIFARFNAPKEKSIPQTLKIIETLLEKWPQNPLAADLKEIAIQLQKLVA